MIIWSTTRASFWRKIDRTIGLRAPVRPFYLSATREEGQQLSSNPRSSALDEKQRIHVVKMDSKSKRKRKPVYQPAMAAGENTTITRKPERFSNPVTPKWINDKKSKSEGPHLRQNRNINPQPQRSEP